MNLTNEYTLFLVIGLLILVFEAHRQFNQPAYVGPDGDEPELIYILSPSEIRSRSAFFSAELFYILVIVTVYLLLLFNDAFYHVVNYIVSKIASEEVAAGGNVPVAGGGALTAANPVPKGSSGGSALENAAVPYLVSVTMVVALKVPKVQQLEVLLRSFSQRLFGIPSIPKRLKERIEETPIHLDQIESELPVDPDQLRYSARIDAYIASAKTLAEPFGEMEEFRNNLSRIAAYQLWVSDLHIWPSSEFRSNFRFFKTTNRPLLLDLDALFKDLDLLADIDSPVTLLEEVSAAEVATQKSLRRQLWEMKIGQAKRLAQRVTQMMGLFDQNSSWPEENKPGAKSLRAFLKKARSGDEVRTAQINLAIILLLLSTVVAALSGYLHASRMYAITKAHKFVYMSPDGKKILDSENAQFDTIGTAWDFAFTSLLVYGLSMWAALYFRRRWMRKGTWSNVFTQSGRVPPMTAIGVMFLLVGAIVFIPHFVFNFGSSIGWDRLELSKGAASINLWAQSSKSLLVAVIGGFHGLAVATLMDLDRRQFENRVWIVVVLVYIACMAGFGLLLGNLLSQSTDVAATQYRQMIAEISNMRELLYLCYLAFVAVLTSIAVIFFVRPDKNLTIPAQNAIRSPAE